MDRGRLLGRLAAAQLVTGLVGMALAVKRRHPYDVFWMHGRAHTVGRDSITMGTALSAPVYMLAAQGVAANRLLRGAVAPADRVAGSLGLMMIVGYLGEAHVRQVLRPANFDAVETPLLAVAIALSVSMARRGLGPRG